MEVRARAPCVESGSTRRVDLRPVYEFSIDPEPVSLCMLRYKQLPYTDAYTLIVYEAWSMD